VAHHAQDCRVTQPLLSPYFFFQPALISGELIHPANQRTVFRVAEQIIIDTLATNLLTGPVT